MDIIETFGGMIEKLMADNPTWARKLLITGYRAQRLALTILPNKKLPLSKQYAPRVIMDVILCALAQPESSSMVSIFTPCEPILAAGIKPYSIEALSGYVAGSGCERFFLEQTVGEGVPETMCSFHKLFIGTVDTGLMPKPKFMVYTNLACDANMITFPYLSQKYDIPAYFIDVPYEKSEDAVQNVAVQLRGMTKFVEDVTGKQVSEDALRAVVGRSGRTNENFLNYLNCQKERRLSGDLTSEMYLVFMSHILLGTKEAEKYSEMLLNDIRKAPKSNGLRLLWIHLMPFLQSPINEFLCFSDKAFVTACDLAYESMIPMDASKPYEAMARRMVYSAYNGSADGRIAQALDMAKRTGADGAVVFAHWGCKSTLGVTRLMKSALENEGLPTLILNGDGCDISNNSDGQITTRMGAFLEMLGEKRK